MLKEGSLKPLGCRYRRLVFANTFRKCPKKIPVSMPALEWDA